MTKDEFQRETGEFMTRDENEARRVAEAYNEAGVEGETIVAVEYGGWWCVMLGSAHEFAKQLGLGQPK